MNTAMEGQKLRLIFYDTELYISGAGEDKKISYASIECALETADLYGLVYENQIIILQKGELLLGSAEELTKLLKEKIAYEEI